MAGDCRDCGRMTVFHENGVTKCGLDGKRVMIAEHGVTKEGRYGIEDCPTWKQR